MHRRPPRRRRVRGPAAEDLRPERGDLRRRARHARLQHRLRDRGLRARRRRQHRHRLLARPRRGRGHADPQRRRRDVPGQAGRQRLRALPLAARQLEPRPARHRLRAAARDRERPDRGPLPAAAAHRLRHRLGRRGAGALAAPDARLGAAGPVHPDRRDHRPDPHADHARARLFPAPVARVARRRARGGPGREPVGRRPARPAAAGQRRRAAAPLGRAPDAPDARDHREHRYRGLPPGGRGAREPQPARHPPCDRRLRHRLLVRVIPAQPARLRGQDRPLLRQLARPRRPRPGDRRLGDRAGTPARACAPSPRAWRARPP